MPVGKLIMVWLPIALGIVMIGAEAVNFVAPGSVRSLSFTPASSRSPRWRKDSLVGRANPHSGLTQASWIALHEVSSYIDEQVSLAGRLIVTTFAAHRSFAGRSRKADPIVRESHMIPTAYKPFTPVAERLRGQIGACRRTGCSCANATEATAAVQNPPC
jgi:hypothetical protein